jgi:5'-3' exonuclease
MTTAIIDGHYLLHRTLKVQEFAAMTDSEGTCTGGVVGVVKMVTALLQAYTTVDRVIYVLDAGLSARRKALFPEYKVERISQKKSEEITEEEQKYRADFACNKRWVRFTLAKLGCKIIEVKGKEGDDVIGWLTSKLDAPTIIVTEDKDLYQLVSPKCHVFRPSNGNYVTSTNFDTEAVLGKDSKKNPITVPRHTYLIARAILGDTSDGIPGVKGTGLVAVDEIMKHVPDDNLNEQLEAMAAWCRSDKRKRIFQVATEPAMKIIRRNIDLMDVSAEEFTEEEELHMSSAVVADPVIDVPKIREMLTRIEAKQMLEDLPDTLTAFQRLH